MLISNNCLLSLRGCCPHTYIHKSSASIAAHCAMPQIHKLVCHAGSRKPDSDASMLSASISDIACPGVGTSLRMLLPGSKSGSSWHATRAIRMCMTQPAAISGLQSSADGCWRRLAGDSTPTDPQGRVSLIVLASFPRLGKVIHSVSERPQCKSVFLYATLIQFGLQGASGKRACARCGWGP